MRRQTQKSTYKVTDRSCCQLLLVGISVILLLCVFLFLVYIVCSLSVSFPGLANKDVHNIIICETTVTAQRCNSGANVVGNMNLINYYSAKKLANSTLELLTRWREIRNHYGCISLREKTR